MEELPKFYKEEYNYDVVKDKSYLSIEYNFLKCLNKEKKKEVRKRLKDFDGLLRFIIENEINNLKYTAMGNFSFEEIFEHLDKKRKINIFKPNFIGTWKLKFGLNVNAPNKIDKKELFNANKLEHYLLFGN